MSPTICLPLKKHHPIMLNSARGVDLTQTKYFVHKLVSIQNAYFDHKLVSIQIPLSEEKVVTK